MAMLNAYDLKEFYKTKTGAFVKHVLCNHIQRLWPKVDGETVLGAGYPFPYMDLMEKADRSIVFTPSSLGLYLWPEQTGQKNKSGVCDFTALPLHSDTVDRVLLVHGLEFLESPQESLEELWEVLKANGRLIIIIPCRAGFWSGSDKTPLGQGRPYSLAQLRSILKEANFVIESIHNALYTPPFRSNMMLQSFDWLEKVGDFLPMFSGAYIVEASKQIYALPKDPAKARLQAARKSFALRGVTPQPS